MKDSEKLRQLAYSIQTMGFIEHDKDAEYLRELADKLESKPERVSAEKILAKVCEVDPLSSKMWPEAEISVASALKAMREYASQSLILPSDKEIEAKADKFNWLNDGIRGDYAFEAGAIWMKEQITKQQ